ncbi:MAG: hypothetical protein WC466_00725 [Candidatus Izemoplasmatales bacterium]
MIILNYNDAGTKRNLQKAESQATVKQLNQLGKCMIILGIIPEFEAFFVNLLSRRSICKQDISDQQFTKWREITQIIIDQFDKVGYVDMMKSIGCDDEIKFTFLQPFRHPF